jgi:hypothetical protein
MANLTDLHYAPPLMDSIKKKVMPHNHPANFASLVHPDHWEAVRQIGKAVCPVEDILNGFLRRPRPVAFQELKSLLDVTQSAP